VLAGLAVTAVVSLFGLLQARSTTNAQPFTLTQVRDESGQVPSYLLTFVFPFLFLEVHDWRDVLAYLIFAALVAVLVLQTDLVLVNPLWLAAGYHLYQVQTTSDFNGILMSSRRPQTGQTIEAVRLSPSALKLIVIQP